MALTHDHKIYAWGSGSYGECGYGKFQHICIPTEVKIIQSGEEINPPIKQISAGGHHSMILTKSGKVYTFGFGQHGQLGHKSNANQSRPRLVKDLLSKPIDKIAAGWNHSLVLTEKGDLFACGYANFGQLGLKEDCQLKP